MLSICAVMSNEVGFGNVLKLSIGSTDDLELQVTAQYNPSVLDTQRALTWQPGKNKIDNRPDHLRTKVVDNDLEYTGGEGRSLTLDLLFDGVETSTCIEPQIEALDLMATVRNMEEDDPRPHQCVIVWGAGGIKPFVCVIESIAVKYSVFSPMGQPLRAVATVKVKEASVSHFNRPSAFGTNRHQDKGGYIKGLTDGLPRYYAVPSRK